jgi:glycosyltransferase involved in cell wall biosynthesis
MPTAPSVGVVVANFNNASFVATAIESAASQTVRDLRVVVVDDASTDGSDEAIRSVLSRLNDPRFHYVRLASNLGQAGAIRRGLAELDTSFVCFLDSDDYWYPEFVAQHLVAHLNADFPVAVSFCDSHIVDSAGRMLAGTAWWFDFNGRERPRRRVDPAMIPDLDPAAGKVVYSRKRRMVLRTKWSPDVGTNSMASMMLRRDFVDLVLMPPDDLLPLYVDYYLSTFAALLTGVVAIHDALYAYRMHGRNGHTNGPLYGGTCSASTSDWTTIRNDILHLVRARLKSEAGEIRQAFGDYRYRLAEEQLNAALDPRRPTKRAWDRLRRVFQ